MSKKKEEDEIYEIEYLNKQQSEPRVHSQSRLAGKINYGERLFRKGLIKQEEKDRKMKEAALIK